jgi:CDGSH-type Zn-finger protein
MELEPGKYWWCSCGRSAKQPFCDGSHKGTEFSPVPFELSETKKVWLCGCKHSDKKPMCDGAHNRL